MGTDRVAVLEGVWSILDANGIDVTEVQEFRRGPCHGHDETDGAEIRSESPVAALDQQRQDVSDRPDARRRGDGAAV